MGTAVAAVQALLAALPDRDYEPVEDDAVLQAQLSCPNVGRITVTVTDANTTIRAWDYTAVILYSVTFTCDAPSTAILAALSAVEGDLLER